MMSCLVHIRRGFKKAEASDKKLVAEVLTLFNVIYRIEAYADRKKFTSEQRLALRLKYSVPFLEKIKSWLLQQQSAEHLPGTPVYKAINYALGQWDRLKAFAENGNVEPDNNGVERAIRPVTIFRKNSMFAGNEHGAQRVALFYSLIESCKLTILIPSHIFVIFTIAYMTAPQTNSSTYYRTTGKSKHKSNQRYMFIDAVLGRREPNHYSLLLCKK